MSSLSVGKRCQRGHHAQAHDVKNRVLPVCRAQKRCLRWLADPCRSFSNPRSQGTADDALPRRRSILGGTLAGATACLLNAGSAFALETVSASQALQAAKPLAQPEVIDKDKIWLVLIGGAAGLFVLVWLVENVTGFFPAIQRANQAMSVRRDYYESQGEQEQGGPPVDYEVQSGEGDIDAERRNNDAVLKGLQAAREKVAQDDARRSSR